MPLVNFSNVDFDQIKTSIKDYLKANSNFTDYDFEGSNLSTIIDTLAYNTYINSYNTNMVTNEIFIDSATLRENVVSLARNIGYVPFSRKSARAVISFRVNTENINVKPTSLTLKKGIVSFSAGLNSASIFSIPDDVTVPVRSDGFAYFNGIDIFEGTYISQSFNVSSRTPNQKYILPNSGIDTDLIRVVVKESSSSSVKRNFKRYDSLINLNSNSPIYFLQEISSERYELMFGDGTFGAPVQEPNQIDVSYIVSSGEEGNNILNFTFSGSIEDSNGNSISEGISVITTNQPSSGGRAIQSVDSIKTYATQIYSSQNRAVTSADYEALIPTIYPEAASVSAFGGEDVSPPQFGRVFICIKPYNGVFLSTSIKENITNRLKKFSVAGIVPTVVDLKYLYIEADTNVYFNANLAESANSIKTTVTNNLAAYAKSDDLNRFGARFKYSKYQRVVDESSFAITSNITNIEIRRDLEAVLNAFAEYEICFGNRFYIKNHGHNAVSNGTVVGYNIKSTGFRVNGIENTVYLGDIPNKGLKTGTLFLFTLNSPTEPVIVKRNVGLIDYIKGEIKLNPIKVISTVVNRGTPLIEISACPYSNDVIGLQDLFLQLDTDNINVESIPDQIASGTDTSGSNYIVSSSYQNGGLVRGEPIVTNPDDTLQSNVQANTQVSVQTTTVNEGLLTRTTSQQTTSSNQSSASSSSSSSSSSQIYNY